MHSLLAIISSLILCDSISIRYERYHRDIVTESKFELAPIHISCEIHDIAVISAPVVNSKEVLYFLSKPNGDAFRLHFTKPKEDYNKPEGDFTKPEVDFTSLREGFTKSEADFTKTKVDFRYPKVDFNKLEADFTKSKMEFIKRKVDFINPKADFTKSDADFTKPKVDFNKPKVDFIKPKADFTKPKVDFIKVDSTKPNSTNQFHYEKYEFTDYDQIIVKYITKDIITIYPKRNYRVINANFGLLQSKSDNVVDEIETGMKETDFMMGPLSEEYHGNWVLSIYCKDVNNSWIELFQVITIQIIDTVPMVPKKVQLKEGNTFNLRFAYPIKGLQSCELTAPRTSFDRYFDRNRIELDRCGYVVPNVTKEDEGIWSVIGVGNIIYEGIVNLRVINKVT